MYRRGIFVGALLGLGASLSGLLPTLSAAQRADVRLGLVAERSTGSAPTINAEVLQRLGLKQWDNLKTYFRGGGYGWRGWKYSRKPTTVAAEKRKAHKRRNRLRHKARCRGK